MKQRRCWSVRHLCASSPGILKREFAQNAEESRQERTYRANLIYYEKNVQFLYAPFVYILMDKQYVFLTESVVLYEKVSQGNSIKILFSNIIFMQNIYFFM